MSYEEVQAISAMAGLFIFIFLFVMVVAYTFWPGNGTTFDHASRMPLEKDPDDNTLRGHYGR